MIGKEYPSEISSFTDKKTGRVISRLTSKYDNYHLYFTDNSFTDNDREIYFLSTRSHDKKGVFNFCKMDLSTGIITQITDEEEGINLMVHTKTPDSSILIYAINNKIKKVDTKTGASEVIYEEEKNYTLGSPFISPDKKHVGITRNEKVNVKYGANYAGFRESMYAIKKGIVTIIPLDGSKSRDVFEDTHWAGHFQYAPDDNNIAMLCHEGPWNLVQQRIWILDISAGKVIPCFRQEEDDSVGHEFWTRDGYIFFDNRRKGHDGTITSERTQATIVSPEHDQVPYVGLADRKGNVVRIIEMPFYCNHYHANTNNTLLVGDETDDLVLINISGAKPEHQVLCYHGTSWYGQNTHCHPTFSWNSNKILYTSDQNNRCNIYCLELQESPNGKNPA